MQIKKLLLITFLFSSVAFSSGIPTIDVGTIANTLQLLQEAKNQLDELKAQVKTAKSQLDDFRNEALETKKRLEGFLDYKSIFDSSQAYLKDYVSDFSKGMTTSEYNKMKEKYGVVADTESLNEYFKAKMNSLNALNGLSKKLEGEAVNMDKLLGQFENADTPQKREELGNTIAMQKSKMENTMRSIEAQKEANAIEEDIKLRVIEQKYFNSQISSPSFKW